MISKIDKNTDRKRRHCRVRAKISGTAACPRLCVYRSLNHIYAQIIDDVNGNTLVACSTKEKAVAALLGEKNKSEQAKVVGIELTQKPLSTKKDLRFQQLVVWVQSLSQLSVLPLHSQVF